MNERIDIVSSSLYDAGLQIQKWAKEGYTLDSTGLYQNVWRFCAVMLKDEPAPEKRKPGRPKQD